MISIARKNMRAEKARFGFSVAGVAVAVLLLAFMLALYGGWNERIASYVQDVPADLWVSQRGNESFFSASIVSQGTLDDIRTIDGVTGVSSLLGRSLKVRHGDSTYDSYIIGFDAEGIGGPLHIKKGRTAERTGEIVVEDVFARTAGISVGDELVAGERPLTVVGISTGGNLVINQLSFVTKEEARKLVGIEGIVNFILVTTEPGHAEQVAETINAQVPSVTAFQADDFASRSRKVLQRSVLPILSVLLVLVFVVGAVVVGLTIYTSTIEKEREFGVMKALGAPNKRIMAVVAEQSVLCSLLGFAVGEALLVGASRLAERLVPQFVTLVRWQDALIVLVAAVVMSIIASYLPLQRVMRVDPLKVFKA